MRAKDPTQYEAIATFLKGGSALAKNGNSIIDKVNYFQDQHRNAIDRLTGIISSAERLGLAIIILFVATSILITFNTIRLAIYTAREEISIMRLVGASNMYIRGPFVFEGILYGLVSGIVTLVFFYPLTLWLGPTTQSFFGSVDIFDYYISNFPLTFLIIVGSGVALGACSSLLAVRRYLKV